MMRRLLLLTLLSAGVLSAQTRVEQGNRDGVLHLGNGAEPESLDPHLTTGVPEYNIISALMEGLVTEHPQTLEPEPGVAERWETSPDGLTWTFHLRPDARWSNGEPLRASDFVYSYRRILSPRLGAEYAYMLYVLKNGKAFHEGSLTDPELLGVRAVDDHTLVLTLDHPAPYFLRMLNHYSFYPVPPPIIGKHGGPDFRLSEWTRPGNHVGNGPFVLKEWEMGQRIRVEKSPTYWDRDRVRLNGIVFYPIEDAQSEERMYRSGLLHITYSVPLSKVDSYRKRQAPDYVSTPYLTTYYYLINTSRKPFDDVRVRKALALAVDRTVLCEKILREGQLPARWFTPPNIAGFDPGVQLTEDVTEARRLLAEAGFPGGKGFPTFEILYNTKESHKRIAEVVQQMWKQNLGISCTLNNQEWQAYMVTRRNLDFDVARAGWAGDYADPHNFLDLFLKASGNNHTAWWRPEYEEAIAAASRGRSNEERFPHYAKAEALLLRDMPVIPLYWYTRNYLIHASVQGWFPNVLDHHPYKYVWLKGTP